MRTKSKLSITIDNNILAEIEKISKAHKYSKSKLTEEALKLWFKKNTEELMAKGYEEMAEEDQEFADTFQRPTRSIGNIKEVTPIK